MGTTRFAQVSNTAPPTPPPSRDEISRRAARKISAMGVAGAVFGSLQSILLRAPQTLRNLSLEGFGSFDELEQLFLDAGLVPIVRSEKENDRSVVLADGRFAAWLTDDRKGSVDLELAGVDPGLFDALRSAADGLITRQPPRGEVVLLAGGGSGNLVTRHLGRLEAPLERDNYSPEVAAAYGHVLTELRAESPCGRFILLEGPPGTGKSYFVRGVASESDALFVFVSPSLMGRVSAPEVIPALLRERERQVPIVLILEDADLAIVRRAADNLSLVSDLCNLSDGLLAELIDIRILATTNAKRVEIDEAILRPGRLCSLVTFGELPAAQAERVYRRLTGQTLASAGRDLTVAEIYRLARRDGWSPPAVRRSRRSSACGFARWDDFDD